MDLTLACGGDRVAGFGIDLLALGTIGLILARKWRASRWLSAPLIAWYLSSLVSSLTFDPSLLFGPYATQTRTALLVIGCGLVSVAMPFLASPTSQWRLIRPRPRRLTRAYGLVVFVRVEPPADSDEEWRP